MPQLDISTYPSQLFWLAVSFTLLFLLMNWIVIPRIGQVLERREQRIRDDLSRAETVRAEAEQILLQYEAGLKEARAVAYSQIQAAAQAAQKAAAEQLAVLKTELGRDAAAAEERILATKNKAIADIQPAVEGLAKIAAEKLIGQTVAESAIRHAADKVLTKVAEVPA